MIPFFAAFSYPYVAVVPVHGGKMELFQQLYGHPSTTLLYLGLAWLCLRASTFAAEKVKKYFYLFSVLWLLSVAGYWLEADSTYVVAAALIPLVFVWWFVINPLWMFVPVSEPEEEARLPDWFKRESALIVGGCIMAMFIWQTVWSA